MTTSNASTARVKRVLVGLLSVVALLMLGLASPAAAHARLDSSTPAGAEVVAEPPTSVVLTFDEPVRPVPGGFRLYDRTGAARALVGRAVDNTVRADLPGGLRDGSYVVTWRVISDDSHPLSGALTFAIGQPDTDTFSAPPPQTAAVSTTYAAATGLGYLGLMTLIGLSVFEAVVLRAQSGDGGLGPRLKRLAAATALVSYAMLVPLTVARDEGTLAAMLRPNALLDYWRSTAALTLLLGAGGTVPLLLAPGLRRRRSRGTAYGVGVAFAMGSVLPVGHTRTYGPAWLVVGADLTHAAAAAVWFGGLIALGLYLNWARRTSGSPREAAVVLSRFSTLAGGLVGLLAVTGTGLAITLVGSWGALIDSRYGQVLLVKVGLASLVGGLAAWNRFHLIPNLGLLDTHPRQWQRLTRAVWTEAIVLVLVIAATAVLGMQAPGSDPADHGAGTRDGGVTLTSELGSGHFEGTLVPGRLGENVITFRLTDLANQPVIPVAPPEMSVSEPNLSLGPLTALVETTGTPGSYRAVVTIPADGEWRINTAVRVTEFERPAAVATASIAR